MYLESYNLINDSKYGIQQKRSTEYLLFHVRHSWQKSSEFHWESLHLTFLKLSAKKGTQLFWTKYHSTVFEPDFALGLSAFCLTGGVNLPSFKSGINNLPSTSLYTPTVWYHLGLGLYGFEISSRWTFSWDFHQFNQSPTRILVIFLMFVMPPDPKSLHLSVVKTIFFSWFL